MATYLITGGAGFLGINLIRYLLERGHQVVSYDIADFDYPERDDAHWMKHTLCWVGDDGSVALAYRPVRMQTLTNEVSVIPPKKRVY